MGLLRITPHSARPSNVHVPTPTHCKAFQGLHSRPHHNCQEHFLLCLQKSPFPQALLAAKSSMSIRSKQLKHQPHNTLSDERKEAQQQRKYLFLNAKRSPLGKCLCPIPCSSQKGLIISQVLQAEHHLFSKYIFIRTENFSILRNEGNLKGIEIKPDN